MADIEEDAVRRYLQEAHNRGGGWSMAMRMMARRILVLEDRLLRAGVDFPDALGFDRGVREVSAEMIMDADGNFVSVSMVPVRPPRSR